MADYLSVPRRMAGRAPKVGVTTPGLARYLDDLRLAQQARALDKHFGRLPPEPGMFDNIALPDDPVAAERALGAAPRSWLENAELMRAMEPQPESPLMDLLLANDRTQTLLDSRLERLTPEQLARSLPAVGRQYQADRDAARAAEILYGKDLNTAAALAAGGVVGGAALYGQGSRLADEYARDQAEIPELGPDLSEDPAAVLPEELDLGDDSAVHWMADEANDLEASLLNTLAPQADDLVATTLAETSYPEESMMELLPDGPEESMMDLRPDGPEEAVAAAPGPDMAVGGEMELDALPGPQMRSVKVLINAGIPADRAMDIITKGASLTPDEYRMVTGGRR
jgi:hypothetical protein